MYIYIYIRMYICIVYSHTQGLQATGISNICIHTHNIYTYIYKFTAFKCGKHMYLPHLSVFGLSTTRNIFICELLRPNTHTHSHTHTRTHTCNVTHGMTHSHVWLWVSFGEPTNPKIGTSVFRFCNGDIHTYISIYTYICICIYIYVYVYMYTYRHASMSKECPKK